MVLTESAPLVLADGEQTEALPNAYPALSCNT